MTKKIEGMATIEEAADGKVKIEFAPGCFDSFEGTQEELDELIAEIQRMFESGEIEEHARTVDLDELLEEEPEWAEKIINSLGEEKRPLQ
jgi:hypothetical protein